MIYYLSVYKVHFLHDSNRICKSINHKQCPHFDMEFWVFNFRSIYEWDSVNIIDVIYLDTQPRRNKSVKHVTHTTKNNYNHDTK